MAKTRAQKEDIVKKLTTGFKNAKSLVVSEIKGLSVAELTELRRKLRAESVGHTVAKITLLKKALYAVGLPVEELKISTQVAVSYSEDETAPARILNSFSKAHDKIQILYGYLEKNSLDKAQVLSLASLPTKPQLIAQLLSVLNGPARGLVTVLSGNLRGLVRVLSQVKR